MVTSTSRWIVCLSALLCAVAACNGDSPSGSDSNGQPMVDPALVGTWVGPVEIPTIGAMATLTMNLNADGTMSAMADGPPFSPIPAGTWGVANGVFTASGRDTENTLVQFMAPRNTMRLVGDFSAGADGTFDVTKQ